MNVSNLARNEKNELVDELGNRIFNSDIFNSLVMYDHMSQTTPALQYVDAQVAQAFVPNPEEARKYIDVNCSRLLDDNASLANPDINVKNLYLDDVSSFFALVNRICDNPEISNAILGDTFTTENNDSEDSKIPMYLCLEILKAKCLYYLEKNMTPLENFNLTPATDQEKTSNLNNEFSKVIDKTKQLNYNKEYFGQDINDVAAKWLADCQVDMTGSVDLYAKCENTQCLIFITQKQIKDGQEVVIPNSYPMFEVKNLNLDNQNVESEAVTDNSQDLFQDVTVVDNNNQVATTVSGNNISMSLNPDIVARYKQLASELRQKQQEALDIQSRIDQLIESMGNENNISNEETNSFGIAA